MPFSAYHVNGTLLITVDVDFDHLAEVMFVRLFQYKSFSFSHIFILNTWKKVTICSPHLEWQVLFHLLKEKYLQKSFNILLHEKIIYSLLSIWSFIYICMKERRNFFCAMGYIKHYIIYFVTQIVSALTTEIELVSISHIFPLMYFLNLFLLFPECFLTFRH